MSRNYIYDMKSDSWKSDIIDFFLYLCNALLQYWHILYFCPAFFIEKQTTIIEAIMKKRIKRIWQQHEMDHYKKLLHVIKMLLTKREKSFLLVCATFYVLNVNNNIAFSYLRFLLSTERLSHIHTYDVEEYKRIITHANIFVNLHTYIPQKNKVSFYSFCCCRKEAAKEE